VDSAPQYVRLYFIYFALRLSHANLLTLLRKFHPEEEWLLDDLYLGYGFDTPITRLRRPPRKMNMTSEEMHEANMPIRLRSWCAHHVMPLHKCRLENYWLPYKCEHEREMFEKCRYKDYLWRHRLKDLMLLERDEVLRRKEEAKYRESIIVEVENASGGGDHGHAAH